MLMRTPSPTVTLSWDVLGPQASPSLDPAPLDIVPWAWPQHHFHPPGFH